MEAPDKIYIPLYPNHSLDGFHLGDDWMYEPHKECDNVEYINKDCINDMLKTAEDHAYFAGQEKFREKLLKCINEIRAIPHENAIARDLAFQEIINKINSI